MVVRRCYGREGGLEGAANCWGTYDGARGDTSGRASGNPNMCTREAPPPGEYAPEVAGYWYIWVR
jgi:hypothetical protein